AFRAQGDAFVTQLNSLRSEWPIQEDANFTAWERTWTNAAGETFNELYDPIVWAEQMALVAGGDALYSDLHMVGSFNLDNPLARAYIDEHGAQLVSKVNDTTKGYIRTIIGNGLDEGWSYDKVAKSLIERFSEFAIGKPQQHIDSRAHGIAVTEIGNAYERGNFIIANDLQTAGLAMEKSWLTVGDDLVSAPCMANQAQGWIPIGEQFAGGVMQPLQHPYCRCVALYRRVGAGQ
ncbi:phage head morphogenesis protein, partial [Patescibacteria group bacterium]|nr:phage head morphogenesis protein [Patescibacteria group bacterium]